MRLSHEKGGKRLVITQIEIDGLKTFKDFKVELAPFQVIVGPNGSGKSNLFDALHLLSRLADKEVPAYRLFVDDLTQLLIDIDLIPRVYPRSEERRVGKEYRYGL